MADKKIIDHKHYIPPKRGGGQLRREVWEDEKTGEVTRYNLAYINTEIHAGDNGRVFGYDNAHGYHHRHYFGVVSPVVFTSLDATEEEFEIEWLKISKEHNKKSKPKRSQ